VSGSSKCSCFLCESERSLLLELRSADAIRRYREFASGIPILSGFPTAFELLKHLRSIAGDGNQDGMADSILSQLFRSHANQHQDLQQHLVLLILMPALHKTSRQLSLGFPSIAREDIAQHLLVSVLEILRSRSVLNQQSHFAFTTIRLLRRNAFRWALRETRFTTVVESGLREEIHDKFEPELSFESKVLLEQFLSRCLSDHQIIASEYQLLISFKVNGTRAGELAAQLGLSEIAFRHRMQRILNRLRKLAQEPLSLAKRRPTSASLPAHDEQFNSAA